MYIDFALIKKRQQKYASVCILTLYYDKEINKLCISMYIDFILKIKRLNNYASVCVVTLH